MKGKFVTRHPRAKLFPPLELLVATKKDNWDQKKYNWNKEME